MCRTYSLFVCVALASCSSLHYQSEQEARTFIQEQQLDGVSVHSFIEQAVKKSLQEQLNVLELCDGTVVNEEFSQPDTSGRQYLIYRQTTTFSKKKEVSAQNSQNTEQLEKAQEDSSAVHQKATISYIEEKKEVQADKTPLGLPWYVYAAGLVVAVLLGFILALRGKKAFHLKSR